jgi:hypothetical protein
VVTGHPLLRDRTDRPGVTRGRETQVSAQHSVVVALIVGSAGVAQYMDAAVRDSAVRELRRKVVVEADANFPVGRARVAIEAWDGEVLVTEVEHARGSLERPMMDRDLEAKLAALARHGCPGFDPAGLINAIWSIDCCDDVREVVQMTSVGVPRLEARSDYEKKCAK